MTIGRSEEPAPPKRLNPIWIIFGPIIALLLFWGGIFGWMKLTGRETPGDYNARMKRECADHGGIWRGHYVELCFARDAVIDLKPETKP